MIMPRERLQELLSKAARTKVAVIGDLYLDRYGTGTMEGIAREAPVPIVRLRGAKANRYSPGGGANVCANVADLGPRTYPISVFGNDLHGFELTKQLESMRMDTKYIVKDESRVTPTFEKFFATAHGSRVQQVGRVDMENTNAISRASEDLVLENLREAAGFVDAIIVADYADSPGMWVVTESILKEIVLIGSRTDIPIITDSRTRIQMFENTMGAPNEYEAAVGTGLYHDSMAGKIPDEVAEKAGSELSRMLGRPVFLTRGAKGVALHQGDKVEYTVEVDLEGEMDTCGAGDTVDAGIAGALAAGASFLEAAEVGHYAAQVTVQKIGTTGTASPEEILAFYDRYLAGR